MYLLWCAALVGCLAYLPQAMAEMPSLAPSFPLTGRVFEYTVQLGDYLSDRVDWARAGDLLEQHEGVARDITLVLDSP